MSVLDRLAQRAYRAQVRIARAFAREFIDLWDLLSWDDLDGTYRAWSRQVMDAIRRWRQESAEAAAAAYLKQRIAAVPELETPPPVVVFRDGRTSYTFDNRRALSVPEERKLAVVTHKRAARNASRAHERVQVDWSDPKPAVVEWPEEDRRAERVLEIVGPGELKRRAGKGQREREAKRTALVTAAGEAEKQVMRGSRKTALTMVRADDAAKRWQRITGTSRTGPCAFCVMLASRGPVYLTRGAAGFQAHGNCRCQAVPVFDLNNYAGQDDVREWQALWREFTKGTSGADARRAFRRHWEELQREQRARPAAA